MTKSWAVRPSREPDLSVDERLLEFWWNEGLFIIRHWGEYTCYYFDFDGKAKSKNGKNWTGCYLLERYEEQIKDSYSKWLIEKELLNR